MIEVRAGLSRVVVSIGGNDLYGDSRARLLSTIAPWYQRERVGQRLHGLVLALQAINPRSQIFILGLYNPYRRSSLGPWLDEQVNLWDGRLIQRLAGVQGVTVVRIADLLEKTERLSPIDKFHPGSFGYAAIARRVADAL